MGHVAPYSQFREFIWPKKATCAADRVPFNWLYASEMHLSDCRLVREAGSVPFRLLELKSRNWSAVKAEMVSGMVPVRTLPVMARVVSAV